MADSAPHIGCRIVEEDEAQAIVIPTRALSLQKLRLRRERSRAEKAKRLCKNPSGSCNESCKSFADELASLAPNVVVEPEKDRVADRVLGELGFARIKWRRRSCHLKPTPTGAHALVSKIQDGFAIIVVPSALRRAVREKI